MTEPELRAAAAAWRAAGREAVVVTVQRHRGSVPRESGTRMVVAAEAVLGTIGGGHLELQAIATARQRLRERDAGRIEQEIALGPALGQCCGGALVLSFDPLAADDPALWPPAAPRFTLQLYGAGHVGRAVVRLLERLPCRVNWIDEREAEFPSGLLPAHVRKVCVEPIEAEVAQARPGDFHLVLTHSHALDLALTQAILARGDFGWFGLIGSATKRAKFERRLAERGFGPAALEGITCPIGIPGIRGKEPEVIAVAVVAQLLALAPGGGPVRPERRQGHEGAM